MKKSPLIFIIFILFMGCYTTTKNLDQNAYYDGFREDETAESAETETEVIYEDSYGMSSDRNYYYDPYYMNRYMITRYDHAWYWRGMYRPYGYGHHSNFSMYFGYSSGPAWSSWYDYYSYDPYYDYYWDDYSYWHDYYSPHHNYYGSIYRPYSYYPRTIVYVSDGSSEYSNQRRGYNTLTQTSGGITPANPNPVPSFDPYIAVIPPTINIRPSRTSVSIERVQKSRVRDSGSKKRNKSKEAKTRTVKKPKKETSKSSHKKSSAKSTKSSPRRDVIKSKPQGSSTRKSTGTMSKGKNKSKKSDN